MAPPPEPLLDWRVPYVELLAMISVSVVSALDASEDGLRLPSSRLRPSPKPIAVVGTPTARMSAQTTAARPENEKGSLFMHLPTRPTRHSCALQGRCQIDSAPRRKPATFRPAASSGSP